jgi:sugar phosphate permease
VHPIAPTAGNTASLPQDADTLAAIYRKIMWRLLPFLFVAYVLNTIDRINISFAKLRMASDLGLSDAAYGIGAAAFFAGYILFEVPSNLYMQKIGARLTITRIMLLWGLVTIASQVSSPEALYVARFLLGVAEAGFFPGVILYLTYWFPTQRRGRITSLFLMSGTFAGMISGRWPRRSCCTWTDGWGCETGRRCLWWKASLRCCSPSSPIVSSTTVRHRRRGSVRQRSHCLPAILAKRSTHNNTAGSRPCSRIHASTSSALPSFDLCQHQYHRVLDAHADPGLW